VNFVYPFRYVGFLKVWNFNCS